jgi:glycosyltransferase involved in cell wall biosynthesis
VAAIRLIRRERVGWFLTSCPPYSGHVVGIFVKWVTGARWIADFRDPWMTTGSKRLFPTSALSIRVESWLERQVIERCDLALFNVERLKDAYRDRYSDLPEEKFAFLPNGIPPQEPPDAPVKKYEHFTLSYTGSLYVGRSPEPVFEAVSQLISSGTVEANAIRIKLVGQCQQINGMPTASIIRKYGLESVVDVLEPVSYAESQDIVRRSHLALLFAPNLPYQIPAKVYDYLASGSRILAIAEEGGTADIIRDTGSGQAFEAADVDGIAGFILREFSSRSQEVERPTAVGRFDIRKITAALAQHMERIDTSKAAGLRQWAG